MFGNVPTYNIFMIKQKLVFKLTRHFPSGSFGLRYPLVQWCWCTCSALCRMCRSRSLTHLALTVVSGCGFFGTITTAIQIHTLAVARSPLTLYPPKLFTTQVKVASRPWATVTFSNGYRKSGSKPETATVTAFYSLVKVAIESVENFLHLTTGK